MWAPRGTGSSPSRVWPCLRRNELKIGEVYFICERDRLDGTSSSNVKIGIVEDVKRDSHKRLKAHQTGNPRDLELHHVTQTPGPHRVETFLHQQFGPNRVRSEWFRLSDEELDLAVQTAERMAQEAFLHVPVMKAAEELKDVVSSADKIAPTDESTQWFKAWNEANAALKRCEELSNLYRELASDLNADERTQVEEEELIVTEYVTNATFDHQGFAEKYPGLLEEYKNVETTINGSCRKTEYDVDLAEIDRELASFCQTFEDLCEQCKRGEMAFGDLFEPHQILERFTGSYSWDKDVADAHLRVICGSSAGIDGQVTWNRSARDKPILDKERLESEHGEKYREFVEVKTGSRLKTKRRARRAAPPAS